MKYTVSPIVCDYYVHELGKKDIICICNIKSNADLIADILNADNYNSVAYEYSTFPYAKFTCKKKGDII